MKRSTILLATMLLGLTGAIAPLVIAVPAGASAPGTRPAFATDDPARILLYGDSLSAESEAPFVEEITQNDRAEVRTGVHGGTAICDWFDRMDSDLAWEPDAVVIEFSGNSLTPCMRDAVGDAYWIRYRDDAAAAIARFPDARVYLVGTPVSRAAAARRDPDANRLNEIYAQLALVDPRVEYVPADRAVLGRRGAFSDVLPCLPGEPCTGTVTAPAVRVNVVRAPDGAHFCPEPVNPAVAGVTGPCPVWSSGAYRFGRAMAEPVIMDLGL